MLNYIGFIALSQDPCVFIAQKGKRIMLISIYVDMILATNDTVWMEDIKKQLGSIFEMKGMGNISIFLGIESSHDYEIRVYLRQKLYLDKVLEHFGMSECEPVMTPINMNVKLEKPEGSRSGL